MPHPKHGGLPSALGGCGGNDELPGKPSVAGGGVVSTTAANIIELSIAKEAAVEAENFMEAQRLKLQIKELASKLGEQTEARGWHHNTTTTTFPEHSLYDDAGAAPLENASLYAALLKANIKAHSLETALKEALLQGKASEKSAAAATASAAAASAAAEAAAAKAAAAKAVATAETASKAATRTSGVAAPRHQAVWNGWARPLATSVPQSDWLPPERVIIACEIVGFISLATRPSVCSSRRSSTRSIRRLKTRVSGVINGMIRVDVALGKRAT